MEIANALPATASAARRIGAALLSHCACGALYVDHIVGHPISGYCILIKNTRTAKLPGVLRITAVKL